jgi:hypothetical protein
LGDEALERRGENLHGCSRRLARQDDVSLRSRGGVDSGLEARILPPLLMPLNRFGEGDHHGIERAHGSLHCE